MITLSEFSLCNSHTGGEEQYRGSPEQYRGSSTGEREREREGGGGGGEQCLWLSQSVGL